LSDVYLPNNSHFILPVTVNHPKEKKIALIFNQNNEKLDTFDIHFENVTMAECLPITKVKNYLYLPVLTQTKADHIGLYQLTCFKLLYSNNRIEIVSKKEIIDNLTGSIFSFSTQKVGNHLQINFCTKNNNSWLSKTIVVDSELHIVDEYLREIIGNYNALKILSDDNSTFFVSNNTVFTLHGALNNDPLWDQSYNILATKLYEDKLLIIASNHFSTNAFIISKDCKILKDKTLIFESSFRSQIIDRHTVIDFVLNLNTTEENNYKSMQIQVDPETLGVIHEEIIQSKDEYLPFFKYKLQTNEIDFFIYDEVLNTDTKNGIDVKIISHKNEIKTIEEKTNENFERFDFRVFPNPSKDIVQISLQNIKNLHMAKIKIIVYDVFGNILIQEPLNEWLYTLDISQWRQGLYRIGIESSGETLFKSFVVAR
jgi:hypothetical protein